jgi:hypothetical protein
MSFKRISKAVDFRGILVWGVEGQILSRPSYPLGLVIIQMPIPPSKITSLTRRINKYTHIGKTTLFHYDPDYVATKKEGALIYLAKTTLSKTGEEHKIPQQRWNAARSYYRGTV